MKKYFPLFFLLTGLSAKSQVLTVEKIMRDAKWIGTSPSVVAWTYDNKAVLFNWNPEKTLVDSTYSYAVNSKEI